MAPVLRETYEAMPRPRLVVAVGVCALHGGVFAGSSRFMGPVDSVLPVDAYIPGCPPNPYALLSGLRQAILSREGVKLK